MYIYTCIHTYAYIFKKHILYILRLSQFSTLCRLAICLWLCVSLCVRERENERAHPSVCERQHVP